jgi:AbrB family looped-hinge helix DNA binding protein
MTATVKDRRPLTVPDQIRRRAGFKPGDQVEFQVSGGVVIIRKLPSADNEYTLEQRRIIDARLDEAERALVHGPFNDVGEMLAHLKGEVKRRVKSANAIDVSKAFPCFRLPEDAEPITLEQTLQAEDEL